MRRTLLVALVLVGLGGGSAQAATRHAAPTGQDVGPCTDVAAPCSLTRAVAAAEPSDTVAMVQGSYVLGTVLNLADAGLTLRGPGPGVRALIAMNGDRPGVRILADAVTVRDVEIQGTTSNDNELLGWGQGWRGILVERVVVRQFGTTSAMIVDAGTVRDTFVSSSSPDDAAVLAGGTRIVNTTVLATAGSARAVELSAVRAANGSTTTIRNSIVRGGSGTFGRDLVSREDGPETNPMRLDVAHSSFDPARTEEVGDARIVLGEGNQNRVAFPPRLDPMFDGTRQGAGSPTEDAGAPDPALGSIDLDGSPRPVGAVDIGADERTKAPTAAGGQATSGQGCTDTVWRTSMRADVAPNGAPTTATFEVTEAGVVRTAPASPSPGGGTAPVTVTANVEGAVVPERIELVLVNADGTTRTALARSIVTPACAGPPPSGGPPSGGPLADTVRPRLTALRLARSVKRARTLRAAFTLSEPARVRLVVERVRSGRRAGGRCSATARRGARCVRYVAATTATRTLAAGRRRIALPLTLRGRALPRGTYRATLTPTDAAGNVGAGVRARFVVR